MQARDKNGLDVISPQLRKKLPGKYKEIVFYVFSIMSDEYKLLMVLGLTGVRSCFPPRSLREQYCAGLPVVLLQDNR